MSVVQTVYKVRIYPHPSKRKAGPTTETTTVEGYGQAAASAVDKHYKDAGHLRAVKVLHGFVIDGKVVEADLTGYFQQNTRNDSKKPR